MTLRTLYCFAHLLKNQISMDNKFFIFSLIILLVFLLWKTHQQSKEIDYLKETIYMQNQAIESQRNLMSIYQFYYKQPQKPYFNKAI